jgi:hypothetical protein
MKSRKKLNFSVFPSHEFLREKPCLHRNQGKGGAKGKSQHRGNDGDCYNCGKHGTQPKIA